MKNLEKRIAALESKDARPYRWLWRNMGESEAEARARAGIAPDDNIIIFCWRQQDENT